MPIFLCYDTVKPTSYWSAERYRGMTSEFSRRRIKYFSISSPEELREHLKKYGEEDSSIVFFPTNENRHKYFLDRYSDFNIHKILLSNYSTNTATSDFSTVVNDFRGDMQLAISHLKEKGCKKIALFNADMCGYHDRLRIETYKQFVYHEPLIFFADKTVYPVISKLLECNEKIDAIICTNDFSAFCLMLVLNEIDRNWRDKILILSFADTILSSLSSPSLSSVSLNYEISGKEIATIHNSIKKSKNMAYMHIVMKSRLSARETTEKQNPEGMFFSEYDRLNEEKIIEITAPRAKCVELEKILTACDATDLKIIHGLLLSKTIEEISKNLYLSYEAIKYRIKKIKKFLKFTTTAELSAWLKIWIDSSKLEEKIINEYNKK
ncbi:MAG: LacI family DNA-binding transcriptional regulator [Clostridia bacterium]|nr:LacI family DNA-binding transcriptional regulator [Clostridia bacterium]